MEDEVTAKDEAMIEEQMFTFDKFEAVRPILCVVQGCVEFSHHEQKFANEDITHTLLVYLARFRELSADNMKRVVSLLHRQAVKAKAEGLFFKVRDIYTSSVFFFF